MRVILGHAGTKEELAMCPAMDVVVGAKKTHFAAERIRTGKGGSQPALASYVDVSAFAGSGPDTPIVLEACGERWAVPEAERATFTDFLEAAK